MRQAKLNNLKFLSTLLCTISFSLSLHAQAPSHDPCNIVKDGDRYWVFNTNVGIGVISSGTSDFSDWQSESSVFGDTWPSWINDYVPDFWGQFWAPACIYMNNKYYLYYSCSSMGLSQSAIGLATSPSLNNPVWTDHGMVVSSDGSGTVNNAIDPAIIKDDDGRVWMTYGSWFGGITITELDSLIGKAIGELTQLVGGNHKDFEAPYILKNNGYYYLFVNRGTCCSGVNSTYYIQVGRASKVTGPYYGWQTFLQADGRFIGPGHVGYKENRLTYHIYDRDDDGAAKMMNTTIDWINDWPIAQKVSQEPVGAHIPNGVYRIRSSNPNNIIGVQNNAPAQGANVQLWAYTDDDINGQSWEITNVNLHQYKISPNNYSSLSFDVYNCLGDDGANIGLWSYWGGKCQQWLFNDMGNDTYQIRSVLSNKPIAVNGASNSGANLVQMNNDFNNRNQTFELELLEVSGPSIYSYTAQEDENPAFNILDGNTEDDSRWSAEAFPQSVIIDYGEEKSIIGTKLWTYLDRAYQYTTELSDNLDFTNAYIVDRSANEESEQPITDNFETITARYAKITVNGAFAYTGSWVSLTEFEIIEASSKINTIIDDGEIVLYPNPAKNKLNITFSKKINSDTKLAIYNSLGQLLISKNKRNGHTESIDISELSRGIYSIVISNNQLSINKVFIKN